MAQYVSPELYNKYKEIVLDMSLAVQVYDGYTQVRDNHSLTDEEIAERLGLAVDDVREIRCIAECDMFPADEWWNSQRSKQERCERSVRRRFTPAKKS